MEGKQEAFCTLGSEEKGTVRATSPRTEDLLEQGQLNHEQVTIAEWLENIQFQKQFFGGVSEEDVWKKIGELNAMYEAALKAERIRYDTLIEYLKESSKKTEFDGMPVDTLDRG